ncbi:MAG: benzoate/H(+) symporter BenE family transporter [Dehalococcoidia bacterium]
MNTLLKDFNTQALGAGVSAFIWYAFGAVPLHIAVASQLGLNSVESSSWVFIVWTTGAVASIALSLYYRQPIPITWSIPGIVYLGTLAGQFTFAEMVGANLVAGIVILVLSFAGIGSKLMAWLPMPIVMAMFAGSIFTYATRLIAVTVDDIAIAGATVAGYLVARFIDSGKVPPVGLAVLVGAIAVALDGGSSASEFTWNAPSVAMPTMDFEVSAVVAISLPMVVLALGLGNVQGLGFLIGQGYKVPIDRISVTVGALSVVNALFGGHASQVARTGVAIVGSPDAGPLGGRYWANLIAASLTLLIAFAAGLVVVLLELLPASYVFALAGLAIYSSLQGAFEQAFSTTLRFGALTAFVVAATPFAVLGITSAFWAVVIGVGASLIVERNQLKKYWDANRTSR